MTEEKVLLEKEKAKWVEVSVIYDKEGMHVRFEKNVFDELMNDWGAWKDLLTDWQAWRELFKNNMHAPRPDMPIVEYLVDDGLGFKGRCPVHGYVHVQQFPIGKEPMRCHRAVKMMEKQENANSRI